MGKLWHFIWEEDSLLSWLVNIVLAFILIKFIVYPFLGFALSTTHPIVAVVSGSMEHKMARDRDTGPYRLCSEYFDRRSGADFDKYWDVCGPWYVQVEITKEQFHSYPFHNGFNTGDIMILAGKKPEKISLGDVIVFRGDRPDPIIHRVVKIWQEDNKFYFQTKGDHNQDSSGFESKISEDMLVGKALIRVPFIGWIKIAFVGLVKTIAGLFI